MNHVEYYQKADHFGYYIDIDYDYINGKWDSPSHVMDYLNQVFNDYKRNGSFPLFEVTNPLFSDKNVIRIYVNAPSDFIDCEEKGEKLTLSLIESINGRVQEFKFDFWELEGFVYFQFDVTHMRSLF